MEGKLTPRQMIVTALIILMIVGGFAAVKMMQAFANSSRNQQHIVEDMTPRPANIQGP